MIRRNAKILANIHKANSILLLGPRGVGKTSLIKEQLSKGSSSLSFNLLLGEVFRKFSSQSEIFRKEIEFELKKQGQGTAEPLVVFVDEVQRIPELLNEVHYLIEEYQDKLRFILTGSSARKLRREGVNLLAGRLRQLKLHPITFLELNQPLERILQYGQLPSIINNPDTSYLDSYVDVYLKEEIFQESLVRAQPLFTRFLDVAAQYSGELCVFKKIAKLSGISDNTVKEYFQILSDTLLVHRIDGWSFSTIKQLNQQPRFYFFDLGILNAVRGEINSTVKLSSGRGGKLFEHLVVLELIRLNDYNNCRYKFYHYREREKIEIDLILHKNLSEPPIAIEIKVQEIPEPSELKTLKAFKTQYPDAKCYCLTSGTATYQDEGVIVCPWQEGIKEIVGE